MGWVMVPFMTVLSEVLKVSVKGGRHANDSFLCFSFIGLKWSYVTTPLFDASIIDSLGSF